MIKPIKTRGFTLVELLIVIVVIAILAVISVVTYNGVQQRAQAASMSDGLRKVDKALRLWAIEEGFSTWPLDPVAGSGGTPFMEMYTTYPSLNNYLQQPPSVMGVHDEDWFYDNDGDSKGPCSSPYDGVNIVIRFVTDSSLAQRVDEIVDDGDINCGRVRYVDNRIFYAVSYRQAVE